jgi:hypothetical protein
MNIEPIDQDDSVLGEEWPGRSYRLPYQGVVTLDVASDTRLSEWTYFWLRFCSGGIHPAWYRVVENCKRPPTPPEWRPLKSSVKRVLKQTAVDDDDEDPAEAQRERGGKVGAAEKLPAGKYLLQVKIARGEDEYELAGIEFKVKATPAPVPANAAPPTGEHPFSLTRPRCSASAVASLIKLPKPALRGLGDVARPFATDFFPEYIRVNGQQVAEYPWPALMLVTLLPYLHEKHQITLVKSEHDPLAAKISEGRKAPHFIFTDAHRKAFLAKLDGQFPEDPMRDYFVEYNGVDDPAAGKKMVDGIRALRQSLGALDRNSVILLSVR